MSESLLWLLCDARSARKHGLEAIKQRQHARLIELVVFARANSPYYRELYQGLPERVEDVRLLPVTSKKELMARFDDWVTDRDVSNAQARAFVDTPDLVGEPFLGKYTLATTSGTSGSRGIFLLDDRTTTVTNVLSIRMMSAWLNLSDVVKILPSGGRMAIVIATGGHFAGNVGASRLRKTRLRKAIQVFSVHMPLPELVAQLNRFRPTILSGYASLIALLASEQAAGRLHINPVLVEPTSEGLAAGEYDRIARLFSTKVRNNYVATECLFICTGCTHC